MDIDDELMLHPLYKEDVNIAIDEDKHLTILACLLLVQADEADIPKPKCVSLKFERKKTKPRQSMDGHCMYNDYFPDLPTFSLKDLLSDEQGDLLLWMVHRVREYDSYLKLKQDCT